MPGRRARFVFLWLIGLVFLLAILFPPAGRMDWTAGWVWLGIVVGGAAVQQLWVHRRNPGLLERRTRAGPGTPTWDRILLAGGQLLTLAIPVVAALDAGRFRWAPLPPWVWAVGFVLHLPGQVLIAWSMGENPHFEVTVRIQGERGHRLIDTGPYRLVRHPGYLGFLLFLLATPLLLCSAWALLPASLAMVWMIVRTVLEDRFLRARLSGYAEYAERVRYRLLPGLW